MSVSGPSTFSTRKTSAWLARNSPHGAGAAGVAGARGVAGAVARPWPVAGAAGAAQSAVADRVELAQAVQVAAAVVAFRGALAASLARSAFSIALTDQRVGTRTAAGELLRSRAVARGNAVAVSKVDYRW